MNRKLLADRLAVGLDVLLLPLVIPAAFLLRSVRWLGMHRLKLTRSALLRIGVLPVRDHYYEPFVPPRALKIPLDRERRLPGIDLNVDGQIRFLRELNFERELDFLSAPKASGLDFRFGNQSFETGDAEFLYQVIRRLRPARIFEIGSGHSTLMARAAIARNRLEDPSHACRHVCIEPYEMPWLESAGVEVIRQRVEAVDLSLFKELEPNDLLFIDSSHVIRPQGDVVTEYLEILPTLRSGVWVHVHDVFTPRDYLDEWVKKSLLLWNEQYLLEAFLTHNDCWTLMAAVNFLKNRHFDELKRACPYLTRDREPGSLYMRRI